MNPLLKDFKTPPFSKISNSDYKPAIKKAIEKVSEKLHNSYHICLKSYINPVLIDKLKEYIKNV